MEVEKVTKLFEAIYTDCLPSVSVFLTSIVLFLFLALLIMMVILLLLRLFRTIWPKTEQKVQNLHDARYNGTERDKDDLHQAQNKNFKEV